MTGTIPAWCTRWRLVLLSKEGGDRRIVEPAAILHDVGWSALKPEQLPLAYGVRAKGEEARRLNRIHETEGVLIARRILESLEYDRALTDMIAAIIERHDSGKTADSVEEAIVKDSDKLWRFSRTGFWKEKERQGLSAREMYQNRVDHLEGWFFTSSAVKLAREELEKRLAEITEDA